MEAFLPAEYIINVFGLDEPAGRVIYSLTANVLGGGGSAHVPLEAYKLASSGSRNALDRYLLESSEPNAAPVLKERIKSFILAPSDPINRYWLSFYVPGESNMIPFRKTYEALKNLALAYFSSEKGKTRVLWLYGKLGSGRKAHIKLLCDELRLPVMFADMEKMAELDTLDAAVDEIVLESLLTGCLMCFDNIDKFFQNAKGHALKIFYDKIKAAAGLCFATAQTEPECLHREDYIFAPVEVSPPDYGERLALWEHFCSGFEFDDGFDIKSAAERFILSPRQIRSCVEDACSISVSLGLDKICSRHVFDRCRIYSAPVLSNMGRLIQTVFTLDDLVLPAKQKDLLEGALNRARYRNRVYSDWGFGSKAPYGNGLAVLFSGPPGTGKTMAAQVFAGELGLSLFKIDLPMVVSKYIGETEKNLKGIFDEAQAGNCVLFFDEADTLFGKRTEIKDSHDRNANLEVSYLLQRLEEYEGVAILATNIIKNFDEAFKRRFQYIIDFPLPDEECRKTIWENIFPDTCPLGSDIDYEYLSVFKLTGSAIRNCALAAAFMAASKSGVIGMPQIIQALRAENDKCGLGLVIGDYEE